MTLGWPRALKRFFRAPATIVGALSFITLVSVLGASLPQVGSAEPEALARLRGHGPIVTALVDTLALDHLFHSPAFIVALALATVSLVIVVAEQFRRFRAAWTQTLTEAHFRTAPFQTTFLRSRTPGQAGTQIRVRGRVGAAGSLLFHLGLLLVIAAATLRGLWGVSAAVDLLEQEVLPPTVEAWGAQWPGPLAHPFKVDTPLHLDAVRLSWYESGGIRDLAVQFSLEGSGPLVVGINQEMHTSKGRIFVNSDVGPAALMEWTGGAGPLQRQALMMRQEAPGLFSAQTGSGLVLHARTILASGQDRPTHLVLRVTEGGLLRFVGQLAPGQEVALPGGGLVRLVGLPYWVRLHGDRDPGLWLVYVGFIAGLAGAALTYTVTRVDELVKVTPEGDGDRVLVAMRPHRFSPLFRDRFERLVRKHGGPS